MEYTIDALNLRRKKEAHDYLAEVFNFPDYYGKNLDALYDCLSEMKIKKITVLNSDEGKYYYHSVLEVIEDLGVEIELR